MNQLRPYQAEGKRDIFQGWETHDLLMFVLATGGGKTVTFVEIIKELIFAGKKIMLIAHRQELIIQAWQTLYNNKIFAGIIMANYPEQLHLNVQVCSIQTIARRKNLQKVFMADYLVIDEGHHATSENSYAGIIAIYSSAKVLLVTATPYRLSGEGFRRLHPYKETKLVINRTFKQLQREAWLAPFRYFAASIPDLSDVHLSKGDYQEEEAKKAMELAPLVESYLEHTPGKQGVCFTINIAHSIQTVQQYLYHGIPAEHLDSNTKPDERKRILSDFRAGLVKMISNVGIITEGFDFPDLEVVQLARPTKSLNLYLQMVGRGSRPVGGLLPHDSTVEQRRALIANSRKPFFYVLDNAGCWMDHNLPDHEHNWERYFIGTKKEKKDDLETMEMLVYIAEDQAGNRIKTTNPKEIEGLRLVEIGIEERRKVINITSIKELDRLYAMFKKLPQMKKPGYTAMNQFIKHCNKNNILMVDEIWLYIKKLLYDDIETKIASIQESWNRNPNTYPEELYRQSIDELRNQGVALSAIKRERSVYEKSNMNQVLEARFGKKLQS